MQSLRDEFGFMRGNIGVLTFTRTLGQFARSMVFPYASLFILALGGDPAHIGLINSLRPLAGLIIFPIAGHLTDRAGRVKLIALGGYIESAALLLTVSARSWQALAVSALLQGLMVFQFPPSSALIADSLSPRNRARGVAWMNTIAGSLAMASPYVAGAIIDHSGENAGMRLLYGVLLAQYLVSAILHQRLLRDTSAGPREGFRISSLPGALRDAYGGIPATLRELPRSLRALAVVITLAFTCNAVAGSFWVVYATDHIALTATEWGLILTIETVLRILLLVPLGMAVDRYGRTQFILASLFITLLSTSLFIYSTTFRQVLVARAAVGLANALFMPACTALMADTVPSNMRGRVMAAIGRGTVFISAAGGGVGGPGMGYLIIAPVVIASLLGGVLYRHNPAAPWLFAFGATAVSLLLAALYLRDPRRAEV
jgi:DHA1 family multidrug resistance protein-like MFS transporter